MKLHTIYIRLPSYILTSANSQLDILGLSPNLYDVTFLLPQLPSICPFQKLNYTITIQQISPTHSTLSSDGQADNIIVIGPKTVTGHTNVYEVVNSNLLVDAVYSILVEFDTLAGNVSSNATFGKQINMCCKSMDKGSLQNSSFSYLNIHIRITN